MPTRIFLNSRAISGREAAVTGATSLTPIAFPDIIAGNKIQFRFFLVDGFGGYESISGDVTLFTLKLALGDVATRTTLTSTTSFTSASETIDGVSTAAWQCTLDCTGAGVLADVVNLESKEKFIELQVTETATTLVNTYLQMKVQLRNRILS